MQVQFTTTITTYSSQTFLWKVRFALHIIAKRREDRVAFQYQREIASVLGYQNGERIAVEKAFIH
jgi:[protein-PII] uridylyltransferase